MAFAFLHRPAVDADRVEIITGEASVVPTLADLPLAAAGVLAVVPFRQIAERGLTVVDDGTPLVAIRPDNRRSVPLREALRFLPRTPPSPSPEAASFDQSDEAYAAAVRTVLAENIA